MNFECPATLTLFLMTEKRENDTIASGTPSPSSFVPPYLAPHSANTTTPSLRPTLPGKERSILNKYFPIYIFLILKYQTVRN